MQVFTKRENWSNLKSVLKYDNPSGTAVVPGRDGYKIDSAPEDVRLAVLNDELPLKYQQAIEELQVSIDEFVGELPDEPENQPCTLHEMIIPI